MYKSFLIKFLISKYIKTWLLMIWKLNSTLASTAKELEDMFHEFDEDKDGKWKIHDFIRFLLPNDYIIDDREEFPHKN